MSIVASEILMVIDLGGGARQVHERHVDSAGVEHIRQYFCSSSFDTNAALSSNAEMIAAALAEKEADEVING